MKLSLSAPLASPSLPRKVPPSFANLTALEALYLQHNQLTGEVPEVLKDSGIENIRQARPGEPALPRLRQ